MRPLDLFGIFLHWMGGFIGVLGCLFGFAALPGLFGVQNAEHLVFVVFDIPFSKDILDAFPFVWQLVILAGGVFLYAWVGFLFLFSTHLLITALARTFSQIYDGVAVAWAVVLVLGIVQAMLFAVVLYGIELHRQSVTVGLLVLAITAYLFAANYAESDEGEPHVISYQ